MHFPIVPFQPRQARFRRFKGRSPRRRGFTITEVTLASFLVTMVISTVASVLSLSGRMLQTVSLQDETSRDAARALNRLTVDVREAKEIEIVSASQFRLYYPLTDANGRYNRFQTNNNYYIQYGLTTANGTASTSGTYLWRKTNATTGEAVVPNVAAFSASAPNGSTLNVSMTLRKTSGNRTGETTVSQRMLFMRNF
jgi:Tfp pilus assembly protein PilV